MATVDIPASRIEQGDPFDGIDDIQSIRILLQYIYRELAGLDMGDAEEGRGTADYFSTGSVPVALTDPDDSDEAAAPLEEWVELRFGLVADTVSIRPAEGWEDMHIGIAFDNPHQTSGSVIPLTDAYLPFSIGGSRNGIQADRVWLTPLAEYENAPEVHVVAY